MKKDILFNSLGLLFFIIPITLIYSNIVAIEVPFVFNLFSLLSPIYLLIVNIIISKMNKSKYPAWRIIPCIIILFLGFAFSCFYANLMGEIKLSSLIYILFIEFLIESIIAIIGLTAYQIILILLMLYRKNR